MSETTTLASVFGGIATILATIFGYRLSARRQSGRISTTDADALWREAGSLRGELQREIARLNAVLTDARQTFELERHEWQKEREGLLAEIVGLKAERERDDRRIRELERELQARLDAAKNAVHQDPQGVGL